jgi:hypothetical protein
MRKVLAFAFILTLACSGLLITIESSDASAHLSTPEFSVKLVAYPYDVPPQTTTTVNEYTGEETFQTTPGYHVENKSIEITIKNPLNTPYENSEATWINTFYNVRVKGHFGTEWKELYPEGQYREYNGYEQTVSRSDTEYTVIKYSANYGLNEQVDFQVQAREGYHNSCWPYTGIIFIISEFVGEYSSWSPTQTLTIGEPEVHSNTNSVTTNTPSPQTTPTPLSPQSIPPSTETAPSQTDNTQQVTQSKVLFVLKWKDIALVLLAAVTVVLVLALFYSRKPHVKK